MTLDDERDAAARRCRSRPASITSRRSRRKGKLLVFALDEMREDAARTRRDHDAASTARNGWPRSRSRPRQRASCCRGRIASARSVVQVIEGEELDKHRLRRARKGALVSKRMKVLGFVREVVS